MALSIGLEKFLAQLIAEGAQDTLDKFLEDRAMNVATRDLRREWEKVGAMVRQRQVPPSWGDHSHFIYLLFISSFRPRCAAGVCWGTTAR